MGQVVGGVFANQRENLDKVVDARGLSCPLPLVRLSSSIRDTPTGQIVRSMASDWSERDVRAWCRLTGNHLVGAHHSVNYWVYDVRHGH